MIYHRETYSTEHLRKKDFIRGIGYDLSLYSRILNKRGITKLKEDYYHEDGVSIDGTIRIKKYHPLLNKILIDTRTNKKVIIESIHKHWLMGYYWIMVYRVDGTKSHGTLIYENINSIDSTVLKSIKEYQKHFRFEE